jgi:hypothetical protein
MQIRQTNGERHTGKAAHSFQLLYCLVIEVAFATTVTHDYALTWD